MNQQKLNNSLIRLVNYIFVSLAAYAMAITWLEGGHTGGLEDKHRVNW